MRFGLIGDVHAEHERLEVTLRELTKLQVDAILCTGDLVDGPGDVDRVCALLGDARAQVVRGNHDRWIGEGTLRTLREAHQLKSLASGSVAYLQDLPPTRSLSIPGGKLLLCHGVGDSDMQQLKPDDSGYAISANEELLKVLFDPAIAIMVAGHTHVPMVRRFERGNGQKPLVAVNPGTLARGDGAGFATLDLGEATAGRVEFYRIASDLTVTSASRAMT